MYKVTDSDLRLLAQRSKDMYTKCVLLNSKLEAVAELEGRVVSGDYEIDADADVRRTCKLDIQLLNDNYSSVRRTWSEAILQNNSDEFTEEQYFTYYIQVFVGMCALHKYENAVVESNWETRTGISYLGNKQIVYYEMGIYSFDQKDLSYSATENILSISLIDRMGLLDADHRGVLYGASKTTIDAIDENGERLKGGTLQTDKVNIFGKDIVENSIRNAMIKVLDWAGVTQYQIDEVGAYSVASQIGKIKTDEDRESFELEVEKFEIENGYGYNEVPYNLEFELGSSVVDVIDELRDLYPNYETYFDTKGVFRCNMIPSTEGDPVFLQSKYFTPYVIDESYSTNIYDVKNVVEVWGLQQDPDNYADTPSFARHETITLKTTSYDDCLLVDAYLNEYESKSSEGVYTYSDGLVVAIRFSDLGDGTYPSYNDEKRITIRIISVSDTIPDDYDETFQYIGEDGKFYTKYPVGIVYDVTKGDAEMDSGTFVSDTTYMFKWASSLVSPTDTDVIGGWYFLGNYQVHAVALLSNGTDTSITEESIAEQFNCSKNAVEIMIVEDSPFAVEKIGQVVTIKNDGDYANISSDSAAKDNARYELWKSARRQDTIELNMILIPFLDVNLKVEYIKQRDGRRDNPDEYAEQYIVKKISGNLGEGTMKVELMKFYSLYENM